MSVGRTSTMARSRNRDIVTPTSYRRLYKTKKVRAGSGNAQQWSVEEGRLPSFDGIEELTTSEEDPENPINSSCFQPFVGDNKNTPAFPNVRCSASQTSTSSDTSKQQASDLACFQL